MIDKSYLELHAGDFYSELVIHYKDSGISSFELIDEFLFEIVWKEHQLAVKILDENHDHTDSYYLEAKMEKCLLNLGWKLIFIDESDGVNKAIETINNFLK